MTAPAQHTRSHITPLPARRSFLCRSTAALLTTGAFAALKPALADENNDETRKPGITGEPAPELRVPFWIDANGEPGSFSMASNRGKWVFLKCFQKWCPGCHDHGFPTLKAFSDRFHEHPDVAIAGIQTVFEGYGTNTQSAVREMQLRYELPITMGHDPGNPEQNTYASTMVNYRTGGTPWMILVNTQGIVVYDGFRAHTDHLIEYMEQQLG